MSKEGNNDNDLEADGKTDIDVRYLMSRLFGTDSNDSFWIEPTLSSIFTDSRLDSLMREFHSLSEFQLAKALLALSQLSSRRVSECSTMIEGIFNLALAAADAKERDVPEKPEKGKQKSRKRNVHGEAKHSSNEDKRKDVSPTWVPVLASILHTKNDMCSLTTDIGITDPGFKNITDELVGMKRENNVEGTFPHLQYLTEENPMWKSKEKGRQLLSRRQSKLDTLRANLLEKWSNVHEKEGERRRISVPKKMRSFMKHDDDSKPLPKGLTQRVNSIPGKSKVNALEKSLSTRLPGAQISRPINKQVGIKLLDFSEQPGMGKFARLKRQKEIQEEKERKRKEREEKEAEAKAATKLARETEKIQRNAAAVAEREAQERAAVRRAKDIEESRTRLQVQHDQMDDDEDLDDSPSGAVMSGVATNEDYDDLHHVLMADEQTAKKRRELELEKSMRLPSPEHIQSVGQSHYNAIQQGSHQMPSQVQMQPINNQATAASQLLFSSSIDAPQSLNHVPVNQPQLYRQSQVQYQNIQQGSRQTVVHLLPSNSSQQESVRKEPSQHQHQVSPQMQPTVHSQQKTQPVSTQRTNPTFITVPINSGLASFSRISNSQVTETNRSEVTQSTSNPAVVGPMHVISTPQGLQIVQTPISQQEVSARSIIKRQPVSQDRPILPDTVGGTQIQQSKTQGLTVIQPQTTKKTAPTTPQQPQQQQQQQQPQQILTQKANVIQMNNTNVGQQPILLLNNGRVTSLAPNSQNSIIALRGLSGGSNDNQVAQLPSGHRFIITNTNSNMELQPIAPRPAHQEASIRPAPQVITVGGQQRIQQQQTQQQLVNQRRIRQQPAQLQQSQIQQQTSQHVQQQSLQSHLDASKQQLTTTMVSDEQGQRLLLKTVALQNSGDNANSGLVIRPMQQMTQNTSNQQNLTLETLSRVQTQQVSQQQPVRLAPISSLRNPAPQAQPVHILTSEQTQEVQQPQRIILTQEQLQAAIRNDSSISVSQQPATQTQVPAGLPASLMGSAEGRQSWH